MKPDITIVTGTYNRLPLLHRMIDSAWKSIPEGIQMDFVVVDGGSTDGTQEWLRGEPAVTLIEHRELRGAIAAFCDGAKVATGRYVVLANDDILFRRDSLFLALCHLENNPSCGAVAFADNRPVLPWKTASEYKVMTMAAMVHGRQMAVNYAQVGMFRRWLGDFCGWWGGDDPAFCARTYAGDNYLSSRIWESGYTVDAVPGVEVEDLVHEDILRQVNGNHRPDGQHPDSAAYYERFPQGAIVSSRIQAYDENPAALRILYFPIYEPGHIVQQFEKKGLREALQKRGIVYEIDYLHIYPEKLHEVLSTAVSRFVPHIVISQIHSVEPVNSTIIRRLRVLNPAMVWINWNGDVWRDGLVSPAMIDLLKWVDLQLCINDSVIPVYAQHGIRAAYWQIGFEEGSQAVSGVQSHEVIFLANAYSPARKALEKVLMETGVNVGLYGSGWTQSAGSTLYDFSTGKALYQAAKIAIGDNQFPEERGFVSNRIFQALAAGGAMLLHQVVPGLEELTGLQEGVHYVAWNTPEELQEKIHQYLNDEPARMEIAARGTAFVREHHSFDARVRELFQDLIHLARRKPREMVTLKYVGARKSAFGVHGVGMFHPNQQTITVSPEIARVITLRDTGLWIEVSREGDY